MFLTTEDNIDGRMIIINHYLYNISQCLNIDTNIYILYIHYYDNGVYQNVLAAKKMNVYTLDFLRVDLCFTAIYIS